jgi:hypothetical protein
MNRLRQVAAARDNAARDKQISQVATEDEGQRSIGRHEAAAEEKFSY